MKKRVIAWMMAVAVASVSLAGCGGQGDGVKDEKTAADGQTTSAETIKVTDGEAIEDQTADFCDLCEISFECAIDCGERSENLGREIWRAGV